MSREKSYRRHQESRHMQRRLKEDRNQHYNDLSCPCWTDAKAMARFKEQPQVCSCHVCCNVRNRRSSSGEWYTLAEEKNLEAFNQQIKELPSSNPTKFKCAESYDPR
jgi:hypothetical protein